MCSLSGKRKLIVIGASYLQRPLIRKARELGLQVHAFAWEQGAVAAPECDRFYPISIVEKDAILQQARSIAPAGVVSIGSDLAAVTVNYLTDALGLIGNSPQATINTTNKYRMRQTLAAAGLPCPAFWLVQQSSDPLPATQPFPLIVKPTDRSGSRGVTKVLDPDQLAPAIARAREKSLSREVIVETFVEGQEISVESISWQGTHYPLAITDKITTGPPYFVELEHHQPSRLNAETQQRVLNITTRALTALGIDFGASHSELLIDGQGQPWITEIAGRMGGDCIGSHLVQYSTGYDFLQGVIQVALGEFQAPELTPPGYSGIRYLFPQPGRVSQIVDRTKQYPEIVEKEVFVQPGDVIAEVRESAARPGYYIYQAPQPFVPDTPPLEIRTEPC